MITLPYTDRDYEIIFNDIKEIIQTIEPRAEVSFDKANVESIISRVIAGCVDTLSFNQDANILEAFPSTARDSRAVFDLLSIVGYTPKTARSCHLFMTLWNPSFMEERVYAPFSSISVDGKTFYCPDKFRCAQGITTSVEWYQGQLKAPDKRPQGTDDENFTKNYYPNLSTNVIYNNLYKLPEEHTKIDSRTLRVYTEDGTELTVVENPYMTNITKNSVALIPSVNNTGYSLMFSTDVAKGNVGNNFFVFYVVPEGLNVGTNIIPDFGGLAIDNQTPSFSYNYDAEDYKDAETAADARNSIVYEFGWRDTPKSIITKYDAERAVLQNFKYIAAVDVRDGNDYSKCDPSLFDVEIFCKVNEEYELKLSTAVVDGIKNRLITHFNKFKMLPLEFKFHIDDIATEENENVTQIYYWYPDITIYLKEQVDSQDAAAILNAVNTALFTRFATINMDFNEVPRTVDIIETVQNASNNVLYLDIDGVTFIDKTGNVVPKTDITCAFTELLVEPNEDLECIMTLNTKNGERPIKYHSVKIVNNYNETIAYDNGNGTLMAYGPYLDGYGSINYQTGEIKLKLNAQMTSGMQLLVYYKQEVPTYCEYTAVNNRDGIKIALESLKG